VVQVVVSEEEVEVEQGVIEHLLALAVAALLLRIH
jgi:hypothetical protein